ncbi:MAG: serine/threonine-protein kinase [Eubacteriales bacterium]|nr:serine/threonine-protein kinase [Eubacteriales bacterium]
MKEIGRSEHSAVFLVRHRLLDVYRAAKLISKSSADAVKLLQEANLIKNLEHPGIPIIYDIEEDNTSICIIEKYIAGKSLREYINFHKNIEINIILQFSIELCSILEYIHNSGNSGIIHLDLKPDNIIIDEEMHLWLIDFDNSIDCGHKKKECEGSRYFAAPEQYHRLKLDKQSDIYGFGMLLLYMVNNQNVQSGIESVRHNILYPIIKKCLHHYIFGRFENAGQIRRQLECMQKTFLKENAESSEHSVVIKIKGARNGTGATHLCLTMAGALRKMGITVLCIDRTDNQNMSAEASRGRLTEAGTYSWQDISILPDYHNKVICPKRPYQVIIIDDGNYSKHRKSKNTWTAYCYNNQYKIIDVIVTDGKYGRKEDKGYMESDIPAMAVFVNHMNGMQFYNYARTLKRHVKVYAVPCIYDWKHSGEYFEKIIKEFIQDNAPELEKFLRREWLEEMQFEIKRLFFGAAKRHWKN